jgi:anaerobic ribonucleoside-triphosphate reductase activating protein
MTPASQPMEGGTLWHIEELAEQIISTPDIEGITISGGEPFLQAAPLSQLIDLIHQHRDFGVIIYSGYQLETLQHMGKEGDDGINRLLEKTDLLIDGSYIDELNDGLSLRGSSNQRVIPLSSRYVSVIESYYGLPKREVEVMLEKESMMIVGIPGENAMKQWKDRFNSIRNTSQEETTP